MFDYVGVGDYYVYVEMVGDMLLLKVVVLFVLVDIKMFIDFVVVDVVFGCFDVLLKVVLVDVKLKVMVVWCYVILLFNCGVYEFVWVYVIDVVK